MNSHVRYFVAGDAYDTPCLWSEPAHSVADCDECDRLTLWSGYMFGPRIVLMKDTADPAVWRASCRVLVGGK